MGTDKPIHVDGKVYPSIKEAARAYGLSYQAVGYRLRRGWTIEQTFGLEGPPKRKVVPSAGKSLSDLFPDIAETWNWDRNAPVTPQEVFPKSQKRFWWKCSKGHEWEVPVIARTNGRQCPYCTNQKAGYENTLAAKRPDLAEEWHYDKNNPKTPSDVVAGGHTPYWWKCKHGHEWQATLSSRVHSGSNCPLCAGRGTSRLEIRLYAELLSLFEDVKWRHRLGGLEIDLFLESDNVGIELDGEFWHRKKESRDRKKNTALRAAGITLVRLREHGLKRLSETDVFYKFGEPELGIVKRLVCQLIKLPALASRKEGLRSYLTRSSFLNTAQYRKIVATLPAPPEGESLKDKLPSLADQWAFDLNTPLLPEHFSVGSTKKVWWRCDKKHAWEATINNRARGVGCPYCAGYFASPDSNLATLYPEIAKEWDKEKNVDLEPIEVRPGTQKKFWWLCPNGHSYEAAVFNRIKGKGCPYCSGRFVAGDRSVSATHPEFLGEWDYTRNIGVSPDQITAKSIKQVWWICEKGHSWKTSPRYRVNAGADCPECRKLLGKQKKKRYSIDDMKIAAQEKGGECLSETYEGMQTKLKWRCSEGHTWEAIPNNIVHQNVWCPICSRQSQRVR